MSINEIISRFETVRAEKAAAEKEEKKLRALILEYAAGRPAFETEDYTVLIKTSARVTLDTTALYKDFPEMKEVYGKQTTVTTVTTAEKAAAAIPA